MSKKLIIDMKKIILIKMALNWPQVKQTFNKLNEWYEESGEKELYHYIGYLINTKIASVKGILDLSKGKSKGEFKSALLGLIRKEFRRKCSRK